MNRVNGLMVARVFTPIQQQQQQVPRQGGASKVNQSPEDQNTSDGFDPKRQSKGLATVSDQNLTQKIHLNAIVEDFKSTMGAIGTSDQVKGEVETYLQVVALQSKKDSPSVPLIKQTLKTAADSLDGYITNALGQPSRVVRDWVEALLLQNIDYKSDIKGSDKASLADGSVPFSSENLPSGSNPMGASVSKSLGLGSVETPQVAPLLDRSEKLQLKGYIETSKSLSDAGNLQAAQSPLLDALDLLEGKGNPQLEGKISWMTGKNYDQLRLPKEALPFYQRALDSFEKSGDAEKQAKAAYAVASVHDDLGHFQEAQGYYTQALNLEKSLGNTRSSARIYNDLGGLALRQKDPQGAVTYLKQAFKEGSRPEADPALLPDIFSNLGGAYRAQRDFAQAHKAYQVSLQKSLNLGDQPSVLSTLRNLAAVSLEANKPEKAMAYLQQAKALS
jgi:tetratricopeptide (TPR) repeat protein